MDFDSNLDKPAVKSMLERIWGKFEDGPCSGYVSPKICPSPNSQYL